MKFESKNFLQIFFFFWVGGGGAGVFFFFWVWGGGAGDFSLNNNRDLKKSANKGNLIPQNLDDETLIGRVYSDAVASGNLVIQKWTVRSTVYSFVFALFDIHIEIFICISS